MSKNCQNLQNDLTFVSSALTNRIAKLPKLRFSVQIGTVNRVALPEIKAKMKGLWDTRDLWELS